MGAITDKRYKCTKCGHEMMITTNHFGNCWSIGHFNCCSQCPPYSKYPEFGGQTFWECQEKDLSEVKEIEVTENPNDLGIKFVSMSGKIIVPKQQN